MLPGSSRIWIANRSQVRNSNGDCNHNIYRCKHSFSNSNSYSSPELDLLFRLVYIHESKLTLPD